jgi:L-threonylcarbamoyladenylate synthase
MQTLVCANIVTHKRDILMNQSHKLSPIITQAASILHAGGVVALPTETVYGLGADARNPGAVASIFTIKGRPADHPLIVHLADAKELTEWAQNIPKIAWLLAEAFWPGPLTLVLPRLAGVPEEVTGGLNTIALRVPNHPLTLELLNAFGGGIAAPSANRYGRVSPTSAEDVHEELGNSVDMVLDGGRCSIGIESTIIDLSTSTPRILRPGQITEQAIENVIGTSIAKASNMPMCYPGSKPSHYAPRARVILSSEDDALQQVLEWHKMGKRVGLLASYQLSMLPEDVIWLRFSESIEEQAYELYHRLRQADRLNLQVLIAVMPKETGIGHALCDRLRRAAGLGNKVINNNNR